MVAGDDSGDQVRNNVIAGASAYQVLVDSIDASANTVAGNLIGVTHTGTSALETKNAGGILVAGAEATQIVSNAITGQQIGVVLQAKAVALSAGQNADRAIEYSALRTGFPARPKALREPHVSYWLHCSDRSACARGSMSEA